MEGPFLAFYKGDLHLAFYESRRVHRSSALCLSTDRKNDNIKLVACNNT